NNFVSIINGGDEEVDLVADGWTEMYREITSAAIKRRAEALGRPITSEERALLVELADFRKMNKNRARIDAIVSDPETAEALKPWYRQFCKRPCFHDEYLPTFNRANVHLVQTSGQGVDQMTEKGVVIGD